MSVVDSSLMALNHHSSFDLQEGGEKTTLVMEKTAEEVVEISWNVVDQHLQEEEEDAQVEEESLKHRPPKTKSSVLDNGGKNVSAEESQILPNQELQQEKEQSHVINNNNDGGGITEPDLQAQSEIVVEQVLRGGLVQSHNNKSIYLDKDNGTWKCRHCTWTYRIGNPGIDHNLNHKGHYHWLTNFKMLTEERICFPLDLKEFRNGVEKNLGTKEFNIPLNGADIQKSLTTANNHQIHIDLKDEEITSLHLLLSEKSSDNGIAGSKHVERHVKVVEESKQEVAEWDVERVLKDQDTHDLYCPNCNSCITKRVILSKRKRTVRSLQFAKKREKVDEISPPAVSTNTTNDQDRTTLEAPSGQDPGTGPDVFTCLSCFTFFIRTVSGFKLFRCFGGEGESPEPLLPSDTVEPEHNPPTTTPSDPRPEEPEKGLPGQQSKPLVETSNGIEDQPGEASGGPDILSGFKLFRCFGGEGESPEPLLPSDTVEPEHKPPTTTPFDPHPEEPEKGLPGQQSKPLIETSNGIEDQPGEASGGPDILSGFKLFRCFGGEGESSEPLLPSDTVEPEHKPPTTTPFDPRPEEPVKGLPGQQSKPLVETSNEIEDQLGETSGGPDIRHDVIVHVEPDRPLEDRAVREWDILKSIVYGGLVESMTSLSVVSSAAGGDATTLNIVALGLANLVGGLLIMAHGLKDLRNKQYGAIDENGNTDRYQEVLGHRRNFRLHAVVAVVSYLIFGLVAPVTYGFSFYKSDNKEYKLMAVAAASLFGIMLLAIAKAYTRKPPKSFVSTVIYYLSIGVMASGLSYVVGVLIQKLLEKLGLFESSRFTTVPPSVIVETLSTKPGWAYF